MNILPTGLILSSAVSIAISQSPDKYYDVILRGFVHTRIILWLYSIAVVQVLIIGNTTDVPLGSERDPQLW